MACCFFTHYCVVNIDDKLQWRASKAVPVRLLSKIMSGTGQTIVLATGVAKPLEIIEKWNNQNQNNKKLMGGYES